MLQNGITHDEIPGRPGYTSRWRHRRQQRQRRRQQLGQRIAAEPHRAVDDRPVPRHRNPPSQPPHQWFRAVRLEQHLALAVGRHARRAARARLDAAPSVRRRVFPGNGATVPLHSFVTESPNPLTMCGWSGAAGLPLIAMMPGDVTSASATLSGPSGPIATCALHKGNVVDGTARSILDGDNAVVVMPRDPLADGTYTATVNSNGGNVTWSFTVNRNAPLAVQHPATAGGGRYGAGHRSRPLRPGRTVPVRRQPDRPRLGAARRRLDHARSRSAPIPTSWRSAPTS